MGLFVQQAMMLGIKGICFVGGMRFWALLKFSDRNDLFQVSAVALALLSFAVVNRQSSQELNFRSIPLEPNPLSQGFTSH